MTSHVISTGLVLFLFAACATTDTYDVYRDEHIDFGIIQTVAVMPFTNLAKEQQAGERVRDVFITMLMASSGIYVVPQGDLLRGVTTAGVTNAAAPTKDEIVKFAALVKADAVITGVVREYGEVRSASAAANVVSLSLKMAEAQGGRIIWSASSTRGGINMKDRLLGGGGEPMNDVTEQAVKDALNKLFK